MPDQQPDMRLVQQANAGEFIGLTRDWLLQNEAANNLVLGLAGGPGSAQSDDDWWATLERDGKYLGYAFRTPPHKIGLSEMPLDAVPLVVAAAAERWDTLPAVLGPDPAAEAFAVGWCRHSGQRYRRGVRQRIYQLEEVIESRPAPGGPRLAQAGDLPLVAEWLRDFQVSVAASLVRDPTAVGAELVSHQRVWLWLDPTPVSMAALAAGTPNGGRVGYVYTPAESRRRGYAAAVTAHVSREILRSGRRFCFLYADVDNPTANSIYRSIGYQPVYQVGDWLFD